jgi:uncharacterized protein
MSTATENKTSPKVKPSRYTILIPLKSGKALAYNSGTLALAIWDERDLELFEQCKKGEIFYINKEIQPFISGGYVVHESVNELELMQSRYNAHRFNTEHLSITIAPGMGCNFSCHYCFQGQDKPHNAMKMDVQDAIIKFFEERLMAGTKSLSVTWYGGEPLIHTPIIIDLSKRIIDLCHTFKAKYSSMAVSNGYKLTPEVAKELFSLGVHTTQITIDGPEDIHNQSRTLMSGGGSFERVVKNMDDVTKETDMGISIRVNIDHMNKDYIKHLIDDLVSKGIHHRKRLSMYFAPVEALTDGCSSCSKSTMLKKQFGDLEAELMLYASQKGLGTVRKGTQFLGSCVTTRPYGVVILPEGTLYKCWDTVMDKRYSVGSIFETEKLTENALYQRYNSWSPFQYENCRNCKVMPVCAGFCPYKFIHTEHTHDEAGSLPCPSIKFNINERMFKSAVERGLLSPEEWDPERSPTNHDDIGHPYTKEKLMAGPSPIQSDAPNCPSKISEESPALL